MSSRAEHYIELMKQQAICNVDKWGEQDRDKLVLVCIEELGELAQAHLQHEEEEGERQRIIEEAIDLGAVGFQFGVEPDVGTAISLVYMQASALQLAATKITCLLSCVSGIYASRYREDRVRLSGQIIVLCACICAEVEAAANANA